MSYSLPVYRRGFLLSSQQQVSEDIADQVARRVVEHGDEFLDAFTASTRSAGGTGYRLAKNEETRRHHPDKRIFDFPAVDLRVEPYEIESRSSLTVCVGTRKSKLWTRLTCVGVNEADARELDVSEVKQYFERAEEVAKVALEGLLKIYRKHLTAVGIKIQQRKPYSFSFRAYNSHSGDVRDLFQKLSYDLTLKEALEEEAFGPQLHDFFDVALENGSEMSSKALVKWPVLPSKKRFRDIFTYRLPKHRALYTLQSTDRHTDLCGFGYDRRGRKPNNTLAFLTTSGLLEEFAHRF